MIVYIGKLLQEYLKQAIGAFIRVYHYLPDELRKLLSRLEDKNEEENNSNDKEESKKNKRERKKGGKK